MAIPPHDRPWVIVGNPENRRVTLFQAALARLGRPPALVLSYQQLLEDRRLLEQVPTAALVRLESPGENAAVEHALICLGARERQQPPPPAPIDSLRGRVAHVDLWYAGYRRLLGEVAATLDPRQVAWLNHPDDILIMFDKWTCQQRLRAAGLPTPRPLGLIADYADLRAQTAGRTRVALFLKLRYGSSASGVLAYRRHGEREAVTTSVALERVGDTTTLFNSLQIRQYTDRADIQTIVDHLGGCGLYAETWVPKARAAGGGFDFRLLVIAGRVRHRVARVSASPMTNLHLGNQRGDLDAIRRTLAAGAWESLLAAAERVARVFPRSLYFGLDAGFSIGRRHHYLFEVNAYGDLLPNLVDGGDDTYTAEIRAFVE